MKNKLKKTMTALCAALILMGGFSVPAYAQGAATEPPAGDATNDSNVVVEEKEETPPLTPKGNATLVDDYGGNKQLITVTTKGGNYFYILIARAAEGDIEACCDLPAEQRTIHLQLRKQYRSLFYRLENPYSDTSRGIRIGEYHGYGLKNINRIVQENHGDFYTKKKDGVFTVQVRLNCEN